LELGGLRAGWSFDVRGHVKAALARVETAVHNLGSAHVHLPLLFDILRFRADGRRAAAGTSKFFTRRGKA
jgi:hypothetical protein